MDDIKISVIVPVYNSEKTLVRCADSILNGTHKNIELIFINDESTDNSLEICLRYADRDGRVKVINKENRGVSSEERRSSCRDGRLYRFRRQRRLRRSRYVRKTAK